MKILLFVGPALGVVDLVVVVQVIHHRIGIHETKRRRLHRITHAFPLDHPLVVFRQQALRVTPIQRQTQHARSEALALVTRGVCTRIQPLVDGVAELLHQHPAQILGIQQARPGGVHKHHALPVRPVGGKGSHGIRHGLRVDGLHIQLQAAVEQCSTQCVEPLDPGSVGFGRRAVEQGEPGLVGGFAREIQNLLRGSRCGLLQYRVQAIDLEVSRLGSRSAGSIGHCAIQTARLASTGCRPLFRNGFITRRRISRHDQIEPGGRGLRWAASVWRRVVGHGFNGVRCPSPIEHEPLLQRHRSRATANETTTGCG